VIGGPLKPVVYTKHASREMVNEGIEKVKVEEAIRGDQVQRIGRDKYRAMLRVKGGRLHVIYTEYEDHLRVITAFVSKRRG
jgi:hypothetical protein